MKVTKTTVSNSEIASFIDLELPEMSSSQAQFIKDEVGELILDHILKRVGNAKNPFTGQSYPGLSKDYKKQKKEDGAPGIANLENTGNMLDSLSYSTTNEGIKIFIKGDTAPQADGHNNFSGDSRLPERQFLPKEDESFPSQLLRDVQSIISENIVGESEIKRSDISLITSTVALNAFLRSRFPDLTVGQAKSSILSDPRLLALFEPVMRFF